MWLGPVFHAEMLALARHRRGYTVRFAYGLFVLLIIGLVYRSLTSSYEGLGPIPNQALASMGQEIFVSFTLLQAAMVLLLTPALVAGAIADERQRQTLHYLMASRLSGAEIVVGKAAARLLRMAVLLAIGLPILNLFALFGGVDPAAILLTYAAAASTAYFLAAVAILGSVYAPRPRDAIAQAYLIEFVWMIAAPVLLGTMSLWSPTMRVIGEFCYPALSFLADLSPGGLLRDGPVRIYMSPGWIVEKTIRMIILQLAVGTALIGVGAWRLRPAFRNFGGAGWLGRLVYGGGPKRGRRRIWPRPPVGDRAVLWKEMHLDRGGDVRRLLTILVILVLVGVVVQTNWDLLLDAVRELRADGFWAGGPYRTEINDYLRFGQALLLAALEISMAVTAASSIAAEREGDTWTNLTSTPLNGGAVVGGKILGTLWQARPLAGFVAAGWVFGLAIGAVSPLGVAVCLVELVIFAGFVASLGVAISLWAKGTIQAIALTLAILFFANFGYLAVLLPFKHPDAIFFSGCTPYIFAHSLLRPYEALTTVATAADYLAATLAGTTVYTLLGAALAGLAIWDYDRVVDRPDRLRAKFGPAALRRLHAESPTAAPARSLAVKASGS